MKIIILTSIVFYISGCATSSGVLDLGPDTFSVSMHAAPARGGTVGAKKLALQEANKHCKSEDKYILVTNISTYPSSHFPGGTADITFRCLAEGDPDLQRPNYEKPADIKIETN